MLSASRWSLRLPVIHQPIRAFATRNAARGPRSILRKPPPIQRREVPRRSKASQPPNDDPPSSKANANPPSPEPSKNEAVSSALATTPQNENPLLAPVHIPEDPHAVLKETHPAMRLLDNSTLVVQRQLEMMNVLMGFEQANRYVIMDPLGNHVGYLAEQDHGVGSAVARQMFRTHRSFTTHVFDRGEKEILRFHRPFSWISSRIRVHDAIGDGTNYAHSVALQGTSAGSITNQTSASVSQLPLDSMRLIGAAEQEWGLLRRKYNLFLARDLAALPSPSSSSEDPKQLASGDLPLSNTTSITASSTVTSAAATRGTTSSITTAPKVIIPFIVVGPGILSLTPSICVSLSLLSWCLLLS